MLQGWFLLKKYPSVVMVIIVLCINTVQSDNITHAYKKIPNFGNVKHQPRFLSFNTEDDGDLSVELEFAVPFLSIPVKKTMDAAMGVFHGGAIANINVGALILGGAVIFGMAVVVPLLSSLFFKQKLVDATFQKRNTENNDAWRIMTLIDQALIENNIDTTSCMQHTVCWLANNSRSKLNKGEATSQDKILDGLMTNFWINQLIDGTAIQTAIQSGLENKNCALEYQNCKISRSTLQMFASQFAKYMQYNK